jgi:hypothetical protein
VQSTGDRFPVRIQEAVVWTRREIGLAVVCLAVGSAGQLVQYVVSPLGGPEAAPADNIARAMAHPTAMEWASWLDLSILFFLPALVVVAWLAGARTTRLGWVAAVVAIGTTVPGLAYLLAPDVLYVAAVHGAVTARAIEASGSVAVVQAATLAFLVGHVLGLLLLAVALWRAGSVPRWAAVCLALSPLLEFGGTAAGSRPVVIAGYVLLTAAFAACAMAVAQPHARIAVPAPVLARP